MSNDKGYDGNGKYIQAPDLLERLCNELNSSYTDQRLPVIW